MWLDIAQRRGAMAMKVTANQPFGLSNTYFQNKIPIQYSQNLVWSKNYKEYEIAGQYLSNPCYVQKYLPIVTLKSLNDSTKINNNV